MGLLAVLKTGTYNFVVWTGVINLVMTVTKTISSFTGKEPGPAPYPNFEVEDAKGVKLQLCKVGDKVYPPFGVARLQGVKDFYIRSDDILLCGYPKTGCHWVYQILYMLRTGRAQLSKYGKEMGGMIDAVPPIIIDSLSSPRVLNSHFAYSDLPNAIKARKTKIVVTTRNPKDTVVSYFNHHKAYPHFYGYHGEFADYFELFMGGKLDYGDYFDYYLQWEKVAQTQSDNPIFIVSYEDLKTKPVEKVLEMARFLGSPVTEQFAADVLDACSMSKMKAKHGGETGKLMFRKGEVGDWRNWLTDEMSSAIDTRWEEKMKDCAYLPKME